MSLSLRNSSQYKVSSLSAKWKIVIGFLVLSAFLLLLLSSSPLLLKSNADTLASNLNNDHKNSSILSMHDTDGDGIDDATETSIGTDPNDKYGDIDSDGLYDFEEYLDLYGTPDNTGDTSKYNYNDNDTYMEGSVPILDIYHYFNLTSNKADFKRDEDFTDNAITNFTNHLLWNITFPGWIDGGNENGDLLYLNNLIVNCKFSGDIAGGSSPGIVNYTNNVFLDVQFSGYLSGGTDFGEKDGSPSVLYMNNTFTNVIFSGTNSGGVLNAGGGLLYRLNTFINVNFTGAYAGGSELFNDDVVYGNNSFTSVIFSGYYAGFSKISTTTYENNTFDRVQFRGTQDLDFARFTSANNTIMQDTYDSDGDTLTDLRELLTLRTNPSRLDTDGDTLNDSYEVDLGLNASNSDSDGDTFKDQWELEFNGSTGVDPLKPTTLDSITLGSDTDMDGLNFSLEAEALSDPGDDDTDDDGLNDSYEYLYLKTSPISADTDGDGLSDSDEDTRGTNPLKRDTDGDGLSDKEEDTYGTNPLERDTDGDGLIDGWEVQYQNIEYVSPLNEATSTQLASDTDADGLNLSQEEEHRTNPGNPDTDGDGLGDGWEVRYQYVSNVHPLSKAADEDLASDFDKDDLSLLQEAEAFTNPQNNDTDGDGLNDSYEVLTSGTNATLADTDGDGLNDGYEVLTSGTNATLADTDGDGLGDGWEVKYRTVSGVNATEAATPSVLASDEDGDGLNLTEESKANTNPLLSDTDGDGLGDAWEAKYSDVSGVNPFVNATADELASDTDSDGLNLTEEFKANTDPGNLDTDGDGLGDGWEVKYNGTSGVNPLVAATPSELASDTDNDGLSLLEEFKANLDPGTANNPMQMNTTSTTASDSSSSETIEITVEGSFTFPVVLAIFTSFSLVFVVYRIRRRML